MFSVGGAMRTRTTGSGMGGDQAAGLYYFPFQAHRSTVVLTSVTTNAGPFYLSMPLVVSQYEAHDNGI